MVRPLAEEKNIDLRVEIENDLPLLYQDQAKVQQILTNLLSNAIKFTPEGGRITVGAGATPAGQIEFWVADTGVGIRRTEKEIIFEKFRQGKAVLGRDNLTREYSGTGLGLSIVKELCKLLGGEITVESELGKGSHLPRHHSLDADRHRLPPPSWPLSSIPSPHPTYLPRRDLNGDSLALTPSATGAARNRPRWIVTCSTSSGKSTATSTARSRSRSSPPTALPPPTPCSAAAPSGVARFSQHMLGHAMDFYIPDVPLEQIRYAGLRLQRGGVGFYPTSGSPFVHLDTGSIRHWPRMTHDQLAKVFPDGRTVHVPTDGKPLKGYELARADIEKRGNGDDAAPSARSRACSPRCSRAASRHDEDDEGAALRSRNEKPAAAVVMAAAAAKSAEAVPTPRAKPQVAATLQLASADAQIVPAPKPSRTEPASAGSPTKPSRNRKRRPISSMPAASGTTCRRRRTRPPPPRSPP